jgi:sporulation protein YlmC with PRC-barrel domain
MEIPLDADVQCAGITCGTSVALVLNPVKDKVTHLVVRQKHVPHAEHLVPIEVVAGATRQQIELHCTDAELAEMEPFVHTHFVRVTVPRYTVAGAFYSFPYVMSEPEVKTVSSPHDLVPLHELAVRRGAKVYATDGHIGQVDEFLVDPESDHVTHLVMREGHLWAPKDIAIPMSQIEHLYESEVYLKLSKEAVEQLPVICTRRGILQECV